MKIARPSSKAKVTSSYFDSDEEDNKPNAKENENSLKVEEKKQETKGRSRSKKSSALKYFNTDQQGENGSDNEEKGQTTDQKKGGRKPTKTQQNLKQALSEEPKEKKSEKGRGSKKQKDQKGSESVIEVELDPQISQKESNIKEEITIQPTNNNNNNITPIIEDQKKENQTKKKAPQEKKSKKSNAITKQVEQVNENAQPQNLISQEHVAASGQGNDIQSIQLSSAQNQQQDSKNLSLIKDLTKMNGFKVPEKTQKNEKFSKFCDLFEGIDQEEDLTLNQESSQGLHSVEANSFNTSFSSTNSGGFTKIGFNSVGFSSIKSANQMSEDEIANKFGSVGFNSVKSSPGFLSANSNSKKAPLNLDSGFQKVGGFMNASILKGSSNEAENFPIVSFSNAKGISAASGENASKTHSKFESMFEELSQEGNANGNEENQFDISQNNQNQAEDAFLGFKTAGAKKKLEIDEKKLNALYQSFLDPEDSKKGDDKQQDNSKQDYNDFFSKQSNDQSEGAFFGFKTASKNSKEMKVNPEKLAQLEKAFLGDDNIQEEKEEDEKEEAQFGFASAFGSKKLKIDQSKFKKYEKLMNDDGDDDYNGQEENLNFNSGNKSNKQSSNSKQIKPQQAQNLKPAHQKQNTPSLKTKEENEQDEDDNDPFAQMLKLIPKRNQPPPPKRDRPKPFKQVTVVDPSKATPTSKPTPSYNSAKSSKFSCKSKSSQGEESFLLINESAGKSGKSSGQNSLSKPFNKPQKIEQWGGNQESEKKYFLGISGSNQGKKRYSFLKEDGEERKIFSTPSSTSKGSRIVCEKSLIEIPEQYSANWLIQLRYGINSSMIMRGFTRVKLEELQVKPKLNQQMEIENNDSVPGLSLKQEKSSITTTKILISQIQICSKNINECLKLRLSCSCVHSSKKFQNNLFDVNEHFLSQELECFCNGSSTIGYEQMYFKLKKKEPLVEEKWVRNHFRQIVWKLSCYHNNLVDCPINKQLNILNIYNELEYRYYSEVYQCRRSVLKQIYEQDAVKSLTMVLMIANVVYNSQYRLYLIELTDGWYSFYVVVFDEKSISGELLYYSSNKLLLLDLILKKKLVAGRKVFVNSIALPPLKNLEKFISPNQDLYYQKVYEIYYNSISLAPPTTKLGMCPSSQQKYFPRALKSLRPFGGSEVQTLDVFIIKRYPLCFESGLVKRSFCNPSQMEDEGIEGGKTLGFTILVADALMYYDQSYALEKQPWAEINIHSAQKDLFEQLKEGSRIRLYNLQVNMKGQAKCKFDFRSRKVINNVLYFDTTKKTKIEEINNFIRSRDEQLKIKSFGNDLVSTNRLLLEELEDNMANTDESDREVLLNQIQILRIEMDIIMYIVKSANGSYFGINQNYSAICVTPSKQVLSGQTELRQQQTRKGDDDCSAEDAHLYEKLSKNRAQPVLKVDNNNATPNLDEGKIGIFMNVAVESIKKTNLSTSEMDMYLFSYTFNSSKKLMLSSESIPHSLPEQYKEAIVDMIDSTKLVSSKFQEVSNYIKINC